MYMQCLGMCVHVLGRSFYSERVLSVLFCFRSRQHNKISTEAQASWCRHLAVCNAGTAPSKTPSDGYGAAMIAKVPERADADGSVPSPMSPVRATATS